jgi:O-antigen/teichoic acid export membrane protein
MRLGQTSLLTFFSRFGSSALGFLATVYFARMLGSDVLGVYFLILALVGWLKLGSTVGIPLSITKRVSERNGGSSYIIAGFALISTGFGIVALVIYLNQTLVNDYLGKPLYHFVILLLAAQVVYSFVAAVIKGEHLVHVEGILSLSQTVFRVGLQVVAVYLGFRFSGLLLGEIVAFALTAVLGVGLMLTYFDRSVQIKAPNREHFQSITDFAKYSWLGRLKGRSYNLMDTIVLGFFVSSGLIGVYAICWNISAVLDLFAKSLSNSFFPAISELSSDNERQKITRYLSDGLAFTGLLIIPGFVGAIVIGENILNIYGAEFRKGHTVLVILVAATLSHGYQKQFVSTLDALNRPELSFKINAFFVATNISLNFLFVYLYGWIGAAIATLLSVFVSTILAYRITTGLLDFSVPSSEIMKQGFAAVVMGGLVQMGLRVLRSVGIDVYRFVPVLFLIIFGVIIYFSCLFVISLRFRTTVSNNIPIDIYS